MKTLAICNSAVKNILPESFVQEFIFNDDNTIVSLLSVPTLKYENRIRENDILIKVKAFSCNYRDRILLSSFHKRCNTIGNEEKLCYSPFGSDFVAEVIECGKCVNNLKVGDRVIPNASYPFRKTFWEKGGIPTNFASQRIHIFNEDQLMKIPDSMSDETELTGIMY